MNYKPRHNMAAKKTPKTEADKAGMSNLLARIKEIRTQAAKAQPEDVKKLEGVRQEGGRRGFSLVRVRVRCSGAVSLLLPIKKDSEH